MERTPREALIKMMGNGVYNGCDSLQGQAPRVKPTSIDTVTYINHSPQSYGFLSVSVPAERNLLTRLADLKLPLPTFLLTPNDRKTYPEQWVIWDLKIPVSKAPGAASLYYRDVADKVSQLLRGTKSTSYVMSGNPYNKAVWQRTFNDVEYELKDFLGGSVETNTGISETDYRAALQQLLSRIHGIMRDDRRAGRSRQEIVQGGLDFGRRWIIEGDYSFNDFGADMELAVEKYIVILMNRPAEVWRADLAERQSHRGKLKGQADRDADLDKAVELHQRGLSNREIGRRLFKSDKTIAAWLSRHDNPPQE